MRGIYPSNVMRGQFSVIEHLLKSARKVTHPRKYDVYDIFRAILYVLKEGCTWRGLPHDFPKWNLVCYHYQIWSAEGANAGPSVFERALQQLVDLQRVSDGRDEKTAMGKRGFQEHKKHGYRR